MAKWDRDAMLRPCGLASVKAFSFLHRIRYATRSAGTKDAVCHDESTSDHADGRYNGAALDSSDSADEAILASTLSWRQHGAICVKPSRVHAAHQIVS
jgi:hypothetical protein